MKELEKKGKDDEAITLSFQDLEFTQNYLAYVDTNVNIDTSYFAVFNSTLNLLMNVSIPGYTPSSFSSLSE